MITNYTIYSGECFMKELDHRQNKAIGMSLEGMTQGQIAIALGVSRQAVNAWFQKPKFKTELERQRLEMQRGTQNYYLERQEDLRERLYYIAMNGNEGNSIKAIQLMYQIQGLTKQKAEIEVQHSLKELQSWLQKDKELEGREVKLLPTDLN